MQFSVPWDTVSTRERTGFSWLGLRTVTVHLYRNSRGSACFLFRFRFVWGKETLQVAVGTCPLKVNLVTTLRNPNFSCSAYEGTVVTRKSFPKMMGDPRRCAEEFTRAHRPGPPPPLPKPDEPACDSSSASDGFQRKFWPSFSC